jgi:hypothetical protein
MAESPKIQLPWPARRVASKGRRAPHPAHILSLMAGEGLARSIQLKKTCWVRCKPVA